MTDLQKLARWLLSHYGVDGPYRVEVRGWTETEVAEGVRARAALADETGEPNDQLAARLWEVDAHLATALWLSETERAAGQDTDLIEAVAAFHRRTVDAHATLGARVGE